MTGDVESYLLYKEMRKPVLAAFDMDDDGEWAEDETDWQYD